MALTKTLSSLQTKITDHLLRCKVVLNIANSLFHCEEYSTSEEICRQGKDICNKGMTQDKEHFSHYLSLSIKFRYLRAANLVVENSELPQNNPEKYSEKKVEKLRKAESLLRNGLVLLEQHFPKDNPERLRFMKMMQRTTKQINTAAGKSPLLSSTPVEPGKVFIRGSAKLSSSKIDQLSRQRDPNFSEVSSHNLSRFSNSSHKIKITSKNGFNSDRGLNKNDPLGSNTRPRPSNFQRAGEKSLKEQSARYEDPTLSPKYQSEVLRHQESFRISDNRMVTGRKEVPSRAGAESPMTSLHNGKLPETLKQLKNDYLTASNNKPMEIPSFGVAPVEHGGQNTIVDNSKLEGLDSFLHQPQGLGKEPDSLPHLDKTGSLNITVLKQSPKREGKGSNPYAETIPNIVAEDSAQQDLDDGTGEGRHPSIAGISEDPSINLRDAPVSSVKINYKNLPPKSQTKNPQSTQSKGSMIMLSENTDTGYKDGLIPSPSMTRKPSQGSTLQMATDTYRDAMKTPSRSPRSSQFYASATQESKPACCLTVRHYRSPKSLTSLNRTNTK